MSKNEKNDRSTTFIHSKFKFLYSRDQRKILSPSKELQPNAGTSNEVKTSSQHTKIPPLLKDMDINKVLGKIHPSKEVT